MTDIHGSRVLEVAPGRDETAADTLWNTFSWEQKEQIEAVAMDTWQAYQNSVDAHAPDAEVVHDRFHIAKHLNEAVGEVRRDEHKLLMKGKDETLKGTRSLWLSNLENLSDQKRAEFAHLKDAQLKTARAWAIREQFRWASRSRLKPIQKMAKMDPQADREHPELAPPPDHQRGRGRVQQHHPVPEIRRPRI